MNRSEYRAFVAHWNPNDFQKASQHKLLEKSVVSMAKLPAARFTAFVHRLQGRAAQGRALRSAEQLESLLRHCIGQRLCFKQAEGFGGFGFSSYVVALSGNQPVMVDQADKRELSAAQWWQSHGADDQGYMVEEYLTQHPDVARINASSVNTVRMWVTNTDHMHEVVGAYLRLGRARSQVDNVSSGGLWCPLDIDSVRIVELYDPRDSARVLPAHPDSNVVLEGYQLPHWSAAKKLALDAIAAFPHVGIVGLDVAFIPESPVIIELNVIPDYVGCARMELALKDLDRRMRGQR